MGITRYLLPGCVLAACACPALAQPGSPASRYADIVPSVRPVSAEEPDYSAPRQVFPHGRPRSAQANLEQMTVPNGPNAPGAPPADPVGTLTGQPLPYSQANGYGYPVGSYPSPYYVDGPGCCGPLGRDGRIGYEVYVYTGVNLPFGDGLAERLNAGWTVGFGARTLFFDPTHTAAWTIDLGGSYTHNWGAGDHNPANLFIRSSPLTNQFTGTVTPQPDVLAFSGVRAVHRESFNYNIGRDWWLLGCGNNGGIETTNFRVGVWVGGRYGTSHIDVNPLGVTNQANGYARRQNVFEGVVVGAHWSVDVPMGGWVFFAGGRAEYGHDWTNLAPPIEGNIHSVNLQFTLGVRY